MDKTQIMKSNKIKIEKTLKYNCITFLINIIIHPLLNTENNKPVSIDEQILLDK